MSHSKQPEAQLLARILKQAGGVSHRTQGGRLPVGIGDDAALYRPSPRNETILTCDWFLDGTHFLVEKQPAKSIGWKCLARAVSDVAAMGGKPRCFLLNLALPASRSGAWLDEFLKGLRVAIQAFGCDLAGGDTTRSKQVLLNIAVIGEVAAGFGVTRSGARAGDSIFVSGRLGEAELGLRLAGSKRGPLHSKSPRLQRHLYPEPRLALGQWLARNRLATAMMDLSDGLSSDLARLCAASKSGAQIDATLIPTPRGLAASERLQLALHGGDDYELLFTVKPQDAVRIPAKIAGVGLTRIGTITAATRLVVKTGNGKIEELKNRGWDPFR